MADSSTLLPHPPPTAPPRWLWLTLVTTHALACGYQLWAGHWLFPDSDRYLEAAGNLLRHGTLYAWPWPADGSFSPQEFSIRPPGYPVFLLLLGLRVPLILLVQNALALGSVLLVARWLARHQPMSARRWRLFLLLTLTAPAHFIYANALMSEPLLQVMTTGLWFCLSAFLQSGRWRPLAGAALLTATALLTKPVFYPFAAVLLLLIGAVILAPHVLRRGAVVPPANPLFLLLIAALPLLVALTWQARNYERTGYFHFSSIAEINLLRYNTRAVLRATEGPDAAEQFVARVVQEGEAKPGFAAQQRFIKQEASAALLQHPVAYASLHLRGMLNCLLDPGRFDLAQVAGLPTSEATGLLRAFDQGGYAGLLRVLATQPWGLLLLLALVFVGNLGRLLCFVSFLRNRALPLGARLMAAGLVLYVIGLTGPLGAARFLVPILPLLLLGSGGKVKG